ncbi:MAG: type IV pilus twitching motility protein PilT [Anaerolineales bacterium]|nr:MAG: type IV pilus twitching motility protein PilT [Anaerolineales bacterium]
MNILDLLPILEQQGASDLHLKTDAVPLMRVNGNLTPIGGTISVSAQDLMVAFQLITSKEQQDEFNLKKELDFSYQTQEGVRFRVNASLQKGEISLALRRVSLKIPSLEQLGLPQICRDLALKKQGLVLVTGPTGSGKSTTLAAMIEYLNQQDARRIITIEDPIEYLYQDKLSFITQRELGSDTASFATAAKQSLRQDPDVILVGEMRDPETMAACITAAETGHLVMSTLHTNSAPQSIDRIVDAFPPYQQNQVRMQLSLTLLAVLAQRLIPRLDGSGRVAVVEVMVANNAIRNLIREGKTHQMGSIMQTGTESGMQTMERALQRSYQDGLISLDDALTHANDKKAFQATLGAA